MRGVASSPDFKALLMGLHQRGESLSALSRQHQIAREVLSRWWLGGASATIAAAAHFADPDARATGPPGAAAAAATPQRCLDRP